MYFVQASSENIWSWLIVADWMLYWSFRLSVYGLIERKIAGDGNCQVVVLSFKFP